MRHGGAIAPSHLKTKKEMYMEERNSNTYQREISIFKIFDILRRSWIYILIFTLLFSIAAGVYTTKFVTKKYSSTVKFYILSDRMNGQLGNELVAAKTLVDSYTVVLKHSDSFLQSVAEEAGITGSNKISRVRSMISTGSLDGTEAFYVKITTTDANLAYKVAMAVKDHAPEEIINIVEAGSVKVLNPPTMAINPDNANITNNVIVGGMIGFMLSTVFFILINVFDNHIRSEEDLASFGLPLLGSVPTIESEMSKQKKKKSKKSKEDAK